MKLKFKFFCLIILLTSFQEVISAQRLMHMKSKRFVPPLIYPVLVPTRVQLIFGTGIPQDDLDIESLTNGYVFKYGYFLPTNVTKLYVPDRLKITGRSIPDKIEKYDVEAVQIESGLDKTDTDSNIATTLSELNEVVTDFKELSEIRKTEKKYLSKYRWAIYKALEVAIDRKGLSGRTCVLKTICEVSMHPFHYQNGIFADLIQIILTPSSSVDELSMHSDNEYFQAEVLGKSGAPCESVFKDCKRSLMDIFTNIY